jgi:hypothetical protein
MKADLKIYQPGRLYIKMQEDNASLGMFWKCFYVGLAAALLYFFFLGDYLPHKFIASAIVFVAAYALMTRVVLP